MTKKDFERIAETLKILSNPKRLEILNLLIDKKEVRVTEIINAVKIRKSNVSQHLSILRYLKAVKARPEGKSIFYSLTDNKLIKFLEAANKI